MLVPSGSGHLSYHVFYYIFLIFFPVEQLDLMEEQESTLTTHAIPCTTSELNFPIGQPSPPVHLTKELEGILANLSDPAAQEIRKVVPGFPQGTPLQTMLMFLLVHGDIDKWKTFLSKVVWLTGNSLKKLKEWLSSCKLKFIFTDKHRIFRQTSTLIHMYIIFQTFDCEDMICGNTRVTPVTDFKRYFFFF